MMLVLAVGPMLRWRNDRIERIRWTAIALLALPVVLAIGLWIFAQLDLLPLLGMALSASVAIGSLMPLWGRALRRVPLATWGMVIAHFGVAVALFGMSADTAFQKERLVAARVGETVQDGPWSITLKSIEPVAGPNWTAIRATLLASYDGGPVQETHPQARSFWAPPQDTSRSALLTRWNGQLYTVLGGEAEGDRWQLRLWWKPFVTWIWYGGVLIALGGLLALIGRVAGDLRRRRAQARNTERRSAGDPLTENAA